MLHANCTALSSIEPKLLPIEIYIAVVGIFRLFCSCNLDLDPITFIYELDPCSLGIYRMTKDELSKVIVLHTDIHTYASCLK